MADTAGSIPETGKKDDSILALVILVVAVVIVISTLLYLWKVKKVFNSKDNRCVLM